MLNYDDGTGSVFIFNVPSRANKPMDFVVAHSLASGQAQYVRVAQRRIVHGTGGPLVNNNNYIKKIGKK